MFCPADRYGANILRHATGLGLGLGFRRVIGRLEGLFSQATNDISLP
jgi:hypothetical protein